MVDWSNDWTRTEPGFYVRETTKDIWLAGGWTDEARRRRPMVAGWMGGAKCFEDQAAAQRAVDYLNHPPIERGRPVWHGDWEVVEHLTD